MNYSANVSRVVLLRGSLIQKNCTGMSFSIFIYRMFALTLDSFLRKHSATQMMIQGKVHPTFSKKSFVGAFHKQEMVYWFVVLAFAMIPSSYSQSSTGVCSSSIFNTRVPWDQFMPQEENTLLSQPQEHNSPVCGSFRHQQSCCSQETLQDLQRWSESMDFFLGGFKYAEYRVQKDPSQVVDQLILFIRTMNDNFADENFWQQIRTEYRKFGGKLVAGWYTIIYPRAMEVFQALVTYQEGLLCSACQPNFGTQFLNLQTGKLTLHPRAASDVAQALVGLIIAIDEHLKDPAYVKDFKQLVSHLCVTLGGNSFQCMSTDVASSLALTYFTGSNLRKMICGKTGMTTNDIPHDNDLCHDFFTSTVLRGLYIDYLSIVENIGQYASDQCPKNLMGEQCSAVGPFFTLLLAKLRITFDSRIMVMNVYDSNAGFDIRRTACSSNLSGYACEGLGPSSIQKDGEQEGLSPGAIVFIVLFSLVVLGGGLFVLRHRLRDWVGRWRSSRSEDHEGLGGGGYPHVGLV